MTTIYKSEAGARAVERQYREALRAWPVPGEELRIPTREGETFVLASGPRDAPPLVLLHGSGANTSMWRGDIARWATHFRTYAVDIVGEPGLSAPARPALTSDALELWLDDVLTGLGLSRTPIVATSLGAWVALRFVTRHPERVTRLALLCPGGIGRQQYGWMPAAIVLRLFGRAGVRRSARIVTGLDSTEVAAALDQVALTFSYFKPRTERLPIFSDAELGRLTMPVLAIVGARDVLFDSAETARRLRDCVPDATVHLLPGVGHAILGQTDTVLEFLRR
ncbi:alpha/beta fold hydrolase [Nocardia terpenica]|uniref:Alpha/beta hydrolase n=1 Tax=Nocardia terpenica TaxID=455432 RepID=A0A161Z212_9NOCA|nr:alpha/beta fold hydrolase [Nocardia terpenica]KZM72364.1 alpha/beta hydrolase [Nocardia terpenica]MBF6065402.1 alpha/beta fold hydrolase [Nocardia terpenica]MBF6109084.1 alpha/beta fold hydrolase [Nocardia terpenica]MBF6114714.1 alpha/beta fold hydrolase [Nocardia terpenica]MBF6123399.1 alpha/beta fold hydrolase [Nocardia terpenica]